VVAALAAAVLWASLLPLAAWGIQGDTGLVLRGLGLLVYRFAAAVCHQLPERSFSIGTVPMPVCARCAGLYFGATAMVLLAAGQLRRALAGTADRPRALFGWLFRVAPVRVLVIAAVPTAVTLVYEWITGHDPGNWVRAATGGPLGAAVAAVLVGEARAGGTAPRQLR
jgi:uncharacterized membrane protein